MKKQNFVLVLVLAALLILISACAPILPAGPSILARTSAGTGKSSAQFMQDDQYCRNLATSRVGNPAQIAQDQLITDMLIGSIFGIAGGAIAGEIISDEPGAGAAIGGTAGLATGAVVGLQRAEIANLTAQQRWDLEYLTCMYNLGHKIPVAGGMTEQPVQPAPPPPPPPPPPPAR